MIGPLFFVLCLIAIANGNEETENKWEQQMLHDHVYLVQMSLELGKLRDELSNMKLRLGDFVDKGAFEVGPPGQPGPRGLPGKDGKDCKQFDMDWVFGIVLFSIIAWMLLK